MSYSYRSWTIRDHMLEALRLYVSHGLEPGDFLKAVLANDFQEAVARADDDNIQQLPAFAAYVYNEIPSTCHGSYDLVNAWVAQKGEQNAPT